MSGVVLDVDVKMHTIKTCVQNKSYYMSKIQVPIEGSIVDIIRMIQ